MPVSQRGSNTIPPAGVAGDEGEYAHTLYGAVRLTARGGSLVGTLDDGHRVATAGATLSDHVDFGQGR